MFGRVVFCTAHRVRACPGSDLECFEANRKKRVFEVETQSHTHLGDWMLIYKVALHIAHA